MRDDSKNGYVADYYWIAQLVSLILIHWIVIYLVDSAIQRLNNQGQLDKLSLTDKFTKQESFKKGFLRGPPNSCSTVNETKSS